MSRKRMAAETLREVQPDPIVLEDHTTQANPLWTRSVEVIGYDIVGSERGNPQPGSYVVWKVTIRTTQGAVLRFQRRYSEFDALRNTLIKEFSGRGLSIPELPAKALVARFDGRFLEERRKGLEYFLQQLLLNPEYADSYALRAFAKTH